jgi:PII-like signaling protein
MRSAAKLLRIHVKESDRHDGQPLHEAIVARCRALGIAGATVFIGLEGYGESAELHKAHLVRSDRPVVITVVDTADNIARLTPVVEQMMGTGLLATSDVETIRIEKSR